MVAVLWTLHAAADAWCMCRYADRTTMRLGLLFACRLGNVELDRPVGERLAVLRSSVLSCCVFARQLPDMPAVSSQRCSSAHTCRAGTVILMLGASAVHGPLACSRSLRGGKTLRFGAEQGTLCAGLLRKTSQEANQARLEVILMAQQTPAQREQVLSPKLCPITLQAVQVLRASKVLALLDSPSCVMRPQWWCTWWEMWRSFSWSSGPLPSGSRLCPSAASWSLFCADQLLTCQAASCQLCCAASTPGRCSLSAIIMASQTSAQRGQVLCSSCALRPGTHLTSCVVCWKSPAPDSYLLKWLSMFWPVDQAVILCTEDVCLAQNRCAGCSRGL